MNKKEAIIPLAYIALSLIFLLACMMVFFSKGKSKKWVAWKMNIGALLLSISFFLSCNNHPEPRSTCYVVFDSKAFKLFKEEKIEIEIDSNIIYGYITGRYDRAYSYEINNKKGKEIQKGNVFPRRYASDIEANEFVIELKQNIDTGKYQFKLYNCTLKEQDSISPIHKYDFIIKHK